MATNPPTTTWVAPERPTPLIETFAFRTEPGVLYKTVGLEYASHQRVKHALGQYVRYTADGQQITTNRIEGFWAGLKRQLHGTHHSVSRKHLHRYLSEAEFKYNNRKLTDGERTVSSFRRRSPPPDLP